MKQATNFINPFAKTTERYRIEKEVLGASEMLLIKIWQELAVIEPYVNDLKRSGTVGGFLKNIVSLRKEIDSILQKYSFLRSVK